METWTHFIHICKYWGGVKFLTHTSYIQLFIILQFENPPTQSDESFNYSFSVSQTKFSRGLSQCLCDSLNFFFFPFCCQYTYLKVKDLVPFFRLACECWLEALGHNDTAEVCYHKDRPAHWFHLWPRRCVCNGKVMATRLLTVHRCWLGSGANLYQHCALDASLATGIYGSWRLVPQSAVPGSGKAEGRMCWDSPG